MTPEPGKFYLAIRAPGDDTPISADPLPFKVTLNDGVLNVWGFSIWKNRPDYRTYGIPFRELLERHPGLVITEDRDRRLDKRTRPKRAQQGRKPMKPMFNPSESTALSTCYLCGRLHFGVCPTALNFDVMQAVTERDAYIAVLVASQPSRRQP